MTILWSRRALRDLRDLRRYIAADDPDAAEAVAQRIRDAINSLATFPALGRPGRMPDTRELVVPRTPYIVIYHVRGSRVAVARIIHGAQRWPAD